MPKNTNIITLKAWRTKSQTMSTVFGGYLYKTVKL